jgi:activator of 2-hydroxyglutaryl-CoA dehydratase
VVSAARSVLLTALCIVAESAMVCASALGVKPNRFTAGAFAAMVTRYSRIQPCQKQEKSRRTLRGIATRKDIEVNVNSD